MMQSLSAEQRAELANLMNEVMGDMGLASEMDRLGRALRDRRPDLDWNGREQMNGREGMGMGDAVTALEELADLDELESTLGQGYAGASLDDVDPEALERALGRNAVDDLEALRRIERELEAAGLPQAHRRRRSSCHPAAYGGSATPRCVGSSPGSQRPGRGDHDVARRRRRPAS